MPTVAITEAWLSKLAADEDKQKPAALPEGVERERYWDESLPGFGVIVGKRFASFVVQHRVDGKQVLHTIGRYGRVGAGAEHDERWTVKRARQEALKLLGAMASGEDPIGKRRGERVGGPTLRDAFEAHKTRLRKKGRSPATIETIEKAEKYLDEWLDRPIAELTGVALAELHEQIKRDAKPRANTKNEKGAALANRVITIVGTCWGTLNKQLEGELGNWNPAKSVDKDRLVPKRVRVGDLADWFSRVQTMRNPIQRDGLVFALFTGLRSEDVRTIRFEHVDAKARTLRLPDPKGGEDAAFTIPLSKTCLEILERRRATNYDALGGVRDDGWAFPSVDSKGKVGAIGDLRQQVHEGEKHTRFPAEDVHTLRRTFLSVAQEAGVSELDQHVLSNHSFGARNVNATYIAQHIDHLQACAGRIERALWQRIKPKPESKPTKAKRPKRAERHLRAV